MSRRTERLGEQLRGELARLLHEEAADPRIRLVTLTRVDVAPDLARADVFWSAVETPNSPSLDATAVGLERAAPFLRHRLAEQIQLRRTPELHFHYDPSLALGDRTLAILRELRDEKPRG
ncbi:MAG TPA: 30S ribosome-binding factor RbfA [Myxococcota bacterium]|nr:30S ribosome-binding factor RbfA [Myxococcota bacterium]